MDVVDKIQQGDRIESAKVTQGLENLKMLITYDHGRQETGDRRQETGDRRQETGDRRQETGDRGDRRQGDRRGQETGVTHG